jgi:hypothetical protein
MMELRWQLGIKTKNTKWFDYFSLEKWLITKLLKWRSRNSAGQVLEGETQIPKLLERLMPGMAGH